MKKVILLVFLILSLFLFSSKAYAEIGIEIVDLKPITLKANVDEGFNYDLYVMLGFENNKNGVYRLAADDDYSITINVREGDIYLRAYQVTYGEESSKDVTSCFNLTGNYENDEFIINVEQVSDIEPTILPNRNYDGTKNEEPIEEKIIDDTNKITSSSNEKREESKNIDEEDKLSKEDTKINIIPIIIIIFSIGGILLISGKLYRDNKKIK